MSQLVFFTYSYPYGLGENWKRVELEAFATHFDRVTVVPFCYGGNRLPKPLPPGVCCLLPLFPDPTYLNLRSFRALLSSRLPAYVLESVRGRVFTSKPRLVAWLQAIVQIEAMLANAELRALLRQGDGDSVLYFFWGVGAAWLLPFLPRSQRPRAVACFHRYDLYLEQNAGYIPFQPQLIRSLSAAVAISQHGYDYLGSRFARLASKMRLFHLGACSAGRAPASRDGTLRVLTCSAAVPVKRLDLLADALSRVRARVEWTHIGDGPDLDELKQKASAFPANVRAAFAGHLDADAVLAYYTQHPVDLFVNVSSSEGLPVAVLEALGAGVPVIATDVGGTAEAVGGDVGVLLPADPTADQVAEAIDSFADLSQDRRTQLREHAARSFADRWDARVHAREFADFLCGRAATTPGPVPSVGAASAVGGHSRV
jgi:glycosyltransferase involved in cell wall biosynthesis